MELYPAQSLTDELIHSCECEKQQGQKFSANPGERRYLIVILPPQGLTFGSGGQAVGTRVIDGQNPCMPRFLLNLHAPQAVFPT